MNYKVLFFFLFLTANMGFLNASHIIGGDVHFEQTGRNQYLVTMRVFRDCLPGRTDSIPLVIGGLYYNDTNGNLERNLYLYNTGTYDTVIFGDDCYTPLGLCVEVNIFQTVISYLPDNASGYYFTSSNCCRSIMTNHPFYRKGMTFEAEIPNPGLSSGFNSNPKWGAYPTDAYFCVGRLKTIDLSCSDNDGDSLVYSLVNPLDADVYTYTCPPPNQNQTCISANNPLPRPAPLLTYSTGYDLNNIIGTSSILSINSSTGIITVRAFNIGVFVFRVRCEEYRNGVKIGEVFSDLRYNAVNCNFNQGLATLNKSQNVNINFNSDTCLDIIVIDTNVTDTVFFQIETNTSAFGSTLTLPDTNAFGRYVFSYNDSNNVMDTISFYQQTTGGFDIGVGGVGKRFCWNPSECDLLAIDTFNLNVFAYSIGCDGAFDSIEHSYNVIVTKNNNYNYTVPNVFSPNGDKKNDVFSLDATQHDKCYDVLSVAIYNRWGLKVFESEDPLFQWDGKDSGGADVNEGTYYVILQGFFGGKEVTNQFPVSLFR